MMGSGGSILKVPVPDPLVLRRVFAAFLVLMGFFMIVKEGSTLFPHALEVIS